MRKHYTPAFKAQVVREILREEQSISQIASAHGVNPNMLHKADAQLEGTGAGRATWVVRGAGQHGCAQSSARAATH